MCGVSVSFYDRLWTNKNNVNLYRHHGYDMIMTWLWHGYDMIMTWLWHDYDMVMTYMIITSSDMVILIVCAIYSVRTGLNNVIILVIRLKWHTCATCTTYKYHDIPDNLSSACLSKNNDTHALSLGGACVSFVTDYVIKGCEAPIRVYIKEIFIT